MSVQQRREGSPTKVANVKSKWKPMWGKGMRRSGSQ